jgi:hypothetical protein
VAQAARQLGGMAVWRTQLRGAQQRGPRIPAALDTPIYLLMPHLTATRPISTLFKKNPFMYCSRLCAKTRPLILQLQGAQRELRGASR